MNPIRLVIARPYTVAVAVIFALLFSLLAYQKIPVQLKPTVDQPVLSVQTTYRGASPVEVEEQITRPIEDLLQGISGLEELRSGSVEGLSTVILRFDWGVNKDRVMVDVVNKLSQLQALPPDAEEPVVSLSSPGDIEIAMWIVSESAYDADRVRQIVTDEVEPLLSRVDGVSNLMLVGGEEREVRIEVSPERLVAHQVTWQELLSALRRGYLDRRGGTVETATRQIVVRTVGRELDPAAIADVTIRRGPDGTVKVGDVAVVIDGNRELRSIVRGEGERVIAIGVNREAGANVVTMIRGVEEQLDVLNERFQARGLKLKFESVYRDTTYLEQALEFVWSNMRLGASLAILILLLFLRSWRSVLVVAVSIPISLVMVFLVMDMLGRTVNVVSLAGLTFAAGMVVDNAVVVLENAFRHMEMGKKARVAAEEGGREVWGGVLASTLTTMAVFLPIFGMKEEAGQLFADLAIAIAAAVGFSLIVSLTVVPTLVSLLYRGRKMEVKEKKAGPLLRLYTAMVQRLTGRGKLSILTKAVLLAIVALLSVTAIKLVPPAGYLPNGNANMVFFFSGPIPGTRPEAMESSLRPVEEWIRAQPETGRYFMVFASQFNGGGVILKPEYANGPALDAFQAKFLPVCLSAPGTRFMVPVRQSLFRDSGKQFTVEISGADLGILGAAAAELQGKLGTWPGVQAFGVQNDYVDGRPEYRVEVNAPRAYEAGMSVQDVAAVVETSLAGSIVGTWGGSGRDVDVIAVVAGERLESLESLQHLPVVTPSGGVTHLGALADITRGSGPERVNRIERERGITLTVSLEPDAALQAVLDDVRKNLIEPAAAALTAGYDVRLGGSADKFSTALQELTNSFWLAILLTYLMLVSLFRSWLQPIVILVTVPLAMTGGLIGITLADRWFPGASYDLLAMLGFVILAGIVVNNAILIIHQANQFRAAGEERRLALVQAARTRLRPILMTVATTCFAMLPLATGQGAGAELYQGFAALILGGLVLSSLFTLLLVPALVSLGWDVQDRFTRTPQR
ncbi:MAG: efflux RND transporter permease subunit [Planctomycetota bacterium]|nr:efflux RND transporter permease subunit [Planctomycetota bacterium]